MFISAKLSYEAKEGSRYGDSIHEEIHFQEDEKTLIGASLGKDHPKQVITFKTEGKEIPRIKEMVPNFEEIAQGRAITTMTQKGRKNFIQH
uniref:Uncharacterized protein n=1 Tax=Anguilla anguilla TaxID=7936 RepID=A0A0E9TPR7_ANGAN